MGTQLPLPKNGAQPSPQFSVHVYCGQTAGWTKMPLGMEVGVCHGHVVLDGDPTPNEAQAPIFGLCLLWPNGWIDQDLSLIHI